MICKRVDGVMMSSTFIIAEAGVNHNGDLPTAEAMIDAAAKVGVDAIKFQTFRAESLVTRTAPKAEYQCAATGSHESQYEMLQRLELSDSAYQILRGRCLERGVEFLSTPFDSASVKFLVDYCGVSRLKIPSGEIINAPLLLAAARSGMPLIVSTGMATLQEVEDALGVIAFGCMQSDLRPGRENFRDAYSSRAGQRALQERVTLLHCVTEYPAPFEDMNLRAMNTLREMFKLPVGLSDHTTGIAIPIAAAALGAVIIEKHFTLDRSMPGPDHRASLEPIELEAMVRGIRHTELALGHGRKEPAPSELKNILVARRSLVAQRAISAGEAFTEENVAVRRPGGGVSPMDYFEVIGGVAHRAYEKDEKIVL